MFRTLLVVVWIAVAATAVTAGFGYYVTPLDQRPFSDLNDLFAPTGLVGQGYGVIGSVMIATGVALYAARKRWSALARLGELRHWLEFHIFLCTLGPFLIVLHTTFKVGGLVSISFWSMIVVVLSGFFGRYVYVWIPKTVNGRTRSAESVREERDKLVYSLVQTTALTPADFRAVAEDRPEDADPLRPLAALMHSLRFRVQRGAVQRRLAERLRALGVEASTRSRVRDLVRAHDRLTEQLVLLPAFQRMLRYWHAFHLPLSVLMFAVLGVHVGVAIAFGYTWIF